MLEAISILLALVEGFLLVRLFDPTGDWEPRWAAVLFDAALGACAGMGTASVVFLLLDVAGLASPAAIFGIDLVLCAGLGWLWLRARGRGPARTAPVAAGPGFRWTWVLAIVFGLVFTASLVRVIQIAMALPVGNWDAWAIWNLRAKYLAGPGGDWRFAVSPLVGNGSHPDYPLLVSAFVARVWKAGGTVDAFAPAVTSILFFVALIALLVAAIALLRGAASALLAGSVILCTTSLLTWAPAQYADIPVACFYLAALALIFLETTRDTGRPWALPWAGLCASFAAWTKNEGIAFLLSILAVFVVFTFWRRRTEAMRRTAWLGAGAVPGVLLTLWLKFFLAPAVDPLVKQGTSAVAKLKDLTRYADVAQGFFSNVLHLGSGLSHPLILLAILIVLVRWKLEDRYRLPMMIAASIVGVVFLSFCTVYLITPYALTWQVQSSFDRLILQVWPSFLLLFFIGLRRVADAAPAPAVKKAAARKSPARTGKAAGVK